MDRVGKDLIVTAVWGANVVAAVRTFEPRALAGWLARLDRLVMRHDRFDAHFRATLPGICEVSELQIQVSCESERIELRSGRSKGLRCFACATSDRAVVRELLRV